MATYVFETMTVTEVHHFDGLRDLVVSGFGNFPVVAPNLVVLLPKKNFHAWNQPPRSPRKPR